MTNQGPLFYPTAWRIADGNREAIVYDISHLGDDPYRLERSESNPRYGQPGGGLELPKNRRVTFHPSRAAAERAAIRWLNRRTDQESIR